MGIEDGVLYYGNYLSIHLYSPNGRENGEVIEWSPSVHLSPRSPLSATGIEVQKLKERHHRHKDESHCAYWILEQKDYILELK